MVAADARTAITFSLSAGQAHDAVEGRKILKQLAGNQTIKYVIMDKAYEGEETRQLVMDLNFEAVVPPKSNRVEPWQYNKEMYKQRNEVERLFRRLKGFRRIFSRFDKLDVVFTFFIFFALIIESLK
jgi:transposase